MNKRGEQRRVVLWITVVVSIVFIVFLILLWTDYIKSVDQKIAGGKATTIEVTLGVKIIATIFVILIILTAYWQYAHQKKLDVVRK